MYTFRSLVNISVIIPEIIINSGSKKMKLIIYKNYIFTGIWNDIMYSRILILGSQFKSFTLFRILNFLRACGSVVGWGTMLQAGRSRGSIPDEVNGFFNWPNPSSRIMALGSTQPLTEMSTRNLPAGKGRPVCGADNLTATCESIVYKMWEPQHLTTLWAFMACYRDSFTFYLNFLSLQFSVLYIKIHCPSHQPQIETSVY
jgi:hypothetical protein